MAPGQRIVHTIKPFHATTQPGICGQIRLTYTPLCGCGEQAISRQGYRRLVRVAYTALQSQKAVTACLKSKELLPFGFARQYTVMMLRQPEASGGYMLTFNYADWTRNLSCFFMFRDESRNRKTYVKPVSVQCWASIGLTLVQRLVFVAGWGVKKVKLIITVITYNEYL